MTDYTVTIQSVPEGIEMSVKAGNSVEWIITNKSKIYTDITSIEVTAPNVAGEPQETPDKYFKFIKWDDNSTARKRTVDISGSPTIIATYDQQTYFPTRRPDRRKEKFEDKADEEVYKIRTTALKNMMVEQQEVTTAQQEWLEKRVGDILEGEDIYSIELHHYRNFSQELYGLSRLFKGATLNKEASLKAQKWKTRGLTEARLQKIANLFNITLTFT